MAFLVDSFLRDTVTSVFGAGRHIAWYVSWQTGGQGAVRERPRPQHHDAAAPRRLAV
jgi:hypothetical protein